MFVFPAIPATKETWRRWGLPRFGMPATPTRDLQLLYLHATSTIEMGWRLARETLVENRWPGMILPCRIPVRKSPVRKACDDHHLVKFLCVQFNKRDSEFGRRLCALLAVLATYVHTRRLP